MTAAVCLIFFLSGTAALLFETLWFRLAGLLFGNGVWAASLVLASFMGGLALGNTLAARYGPRLRRPLRSYALLELVIGASGLALVLLLPSLTALIMPLLRPFLGWPAVLKAGRLVLSFGLLLIPSTAMGATLPLLVKTLSDREPNFARTLGRLYGWNTLGAAVGTAAGEGALIASLGMRGTGAVAALLDIAAPEGRVVPRLEARHVALPGTSSRALPLWLLDSQESEMRIAARADHSGTATDGIGYLRAVDALARRDYAEAASRLAPIRARSPRGQRVAVLRVMALHLAGAAAEGSAEAASACEVRPSPVLDAETCAWVARTFPAPP